jgi:hypothetical protein
MTIEQIYNSMTRMQKQLLKTKIMGDGVSYATAYAYCRLQRRPKLLYQQKIALHIKAVTGQAFTAEELFPEDAA